MIFLGPSLSAEAARAIWPEARIAPPIVEGDLFRHRAEKWVILDVGVPAPWPEEILAARGRGEAVIMGGPAALIACELATFGVIGAGEIYQRARGGLERDDLLTWPTEVEPDDAITPIDLEDALRAAPGARAVIEAHLAMRPAARSLAKALSASPHSREELARLVRARPLLTARDAAIVIERALSADTTAPLRARAMTRDLERLAYPALSPEKIGDAMTRCGETYLVVRKKILLRLLARREAARIGMVVRASELDAFVAEWRDSFQLADDEAFRAFLAAEGLSVADFTEVMRDFVLITRLELASDLAIRARVDAHVAVNMARVRMGEEP